MAKKKTEGSALPRATAGLGAVDSSSDCYAQNTFPSLSMRTKVRVLKNRIHSFLFAFQREAYYQLVAFWVISTRYGVSEFVGFTARHMWSSLTRTISDRPPQLTLPQFTCSLGGKKVAKYKYVHDTKRLKTNFDGTVGKHNEDYWMWYSNGSLYDAFLPKFKLHCL